MVKVKLPEGMVELFKLEEQYPDWDKTPDDIKEKMLELALANGGFGSLLGESGRHYLDYLSRLANKLAREEDEEKTLRKLRFFAKTLYDGYSKGVMRKKSTEHKSARIYVMVEEYRANNTGSSISEATRTVAKELGEKHNYTHKRYYDMKDELRGISLAEVKERFGL